MFNLPAGPEIVIIAALALLFFGPRKLPELARSLGQGIAQFKRAVQEATSQLQNLADMDESTSTGWKSTSYTPPAQSDPMSGVSSEPEYGNPPPETPSAQPSSSPTNDDRRIGPLA